MPTYEIKETIHGQQIIRTNNDGEVWCIPIDLANSDYQAYLKSIESNE
jgi:hypothetical protein